MSNTSIHSTNTGKILNGYRPIHGMLHVAGFLVWVLPIIRAFDYTSWASKYFADTRSIDASNDINLATAILLSYLAIAITMQMSVFAIAKTRDILWLIPYMIGIAWSVFFLCIKPEEPIVILGALPIYIFWFAMFTVILTPCAILCFSYSKLKKCICYSEHSK